ncbi:hypothetical protein Cgig2_009399 [Carnegiea gigantea]|uniref:RNase H type-1 domain-containing protein n=1 Tax=Carnegiea gigantea TaxID=171969 RepID=A0A9Q1JSL8_9CARY|nr:hypothetical protein Cgig2_009399 [Carnegiea gigantea]
MICSICGHMEDSATHAVLECPLAANIWAGNCIEQASKKMNMNSFGDFLAVMWECWNAYNYFIFKTPEQHLEVLGKRAIAYIYNFREQQAVESSPSSAPHPSTWTPPMAGYVKLNFDGGFIGPSFAGWGFAVRDHGGHILQAGGKHSKRTDTTLIEETRACLHALKCTYDYGFCSIIIKGDNLQLIQMLKTRSPPIISLVFSLKIFSLPLQVFDFYSLSFVKRGGNRVIHDLAH